MPTIERDWTSSNYAFIDPDTIEVVSGSGTVTVHGDGRIDIVNNGSRDFVFKTDYIYFAEDYYDTWGNQYAVATINPEALSSLYSLVVSFSDIWDSYLRGTINWTGGTSATTQYSDRNDMSKVTRCQITIGVFGNSSITDMELGLFHGQSAAAWQSAYKPFSEDGWLFVRWLYQNEDGTWPDFTDPYDTETYTLPAGVQPIPEEAFVPDPAKVPSSGKYVLDESQSDTGTVSITAGSTRMAAIYFKLNFTVTYHDATGTNADVATGSLDYGASTPTAPSFTRDGYTLIGWTPEPSATVTQDVTYTARWQVATAQYHVDTYLQRAGSYPEQPSSTIARTGNVGSTVSLTTEDKTPAQGYAYDTGAANVESGVVTIDGALRLKAYFKQQFSVTYTDGVSTAEVFPDQTMGGLDYGAATPQFSGTPTRTGYDFTGWTPEVAGTVTADATYAATWKIQSCPYQIRYLYQVAGSYDTGTAIVETSETRYGNYGFTVQATESDKTPTKPGYVLDSAYPVNGVTLTDKNTTAYVDVHFKQQFTVTYTDGVPDAQVFEDEVHSGLDYGTYTPTYDGTPSREGYNFLGWSPTVAQTVTADATYTAQWEEAIDYASYRVEYYYQTSGSYPGTASSYDTRTAEVGTTVSLTAEDKQPTRVGYVYDTAASNVESAQLADSGTVLKAFFKQQFTVTYTDGEAGGASFEDQTTSGLDYGATTPFFSGTPEWYGHTFTGWSPSVAPTVTADATYTAQWDRETAQYEVERYLQASGQYSSAATSSTTRSGYVGDTVELNVQDMTPPSGYTYDDDAANVEEAVLQPSGTVLKAYFKQKFTVTYTDGVSGEEVFADQTYQNLYWGDQTPSFTGTPSREGYSFAGWTPRVSATVQGDATYTATWRDRPRPILTIGGKALSDFGECVASRNTGAPEKKTSTVTVPHMSGFWDFSKIYGALAYESREVTYTIELLGDDRADLQDRKSALMAWLLATHDQAIYDDDIKGWHFVGSCSGCEWEEGDEGESGTITATFLCQPFLYADDETSVSVPEGSQVVSNPGEALNPMASAASGTATVTLGGVTQSVTTTPTRLVGQLVPGDNNVTVSGGTVTLTWYETRI